MSVRVGVIGLGIAGRRHLDAYAQHPNVDVAAVADIDRTIGAKVADEMAVRYCADYEDLLRLDLDAVSICVPHARLGPIAIQSAEYGRHILLEKPMATSVAQADEIIRACRDHDVLLMVGFVHRFRDEVMRAKQLLRDELIGAPYFVVDRFHSGGDSIAPSWIWDRRISGGGVLFYNGVHSIDRLRWLMGSEIARIAAVARSLAHQIDVEDVVVANAEFDNGVVACLIQNFAPHTAGNRWETEFFGPRGVLRITTGSGVQVVSETGSDEYRVADDRRFVREIEAFVQSVEERSLPPIGGQDGRAALAVVEAIYRSSSLGGTWVSVA